jgi:acyl dehydratase
MRGNRENHERAQRTMADYSSIRDGRIFESAAPIRITRELIADFCAAIGETNPLYTDARAASPHGGIVAPPSLAAIFGDGENIFPHYPELDTRRLLAGIDMELLAPIRAGDTLRITSRISEVYEKTGRSGSMVFVVISSVLTNQNGEIAVRIDHRFTNPL